MGERTEETCGDCTNCCINEAVAALPAGADEQQIIGGIAKGLSVAFERFGVERAIEGAAEFIGYLASAVFAATTALEAVQHAASELEAERDALLELVRHLRSGEEPVEPDESANALYRAYFERRAELEKQLYDMGVDLDA